MESPENRNLENREDQIAAYCDGEMTPDEATAFERRMQSDAALRRDVEQWREALDAARDWMATEAPGTDRAARLEVPAVAHRAKAAIKPARIVSVFSRSWLRHGLAAAAIFLAGVYFGFELKGGTPAPSSGVTGAPPGQISPEPVQTAPAPIGHPEPAPAEREVAVLPNQRYTDEHGRLVVETTLKGSGARALWVVDGKFQLAQFLPNQ